VIFVCNIFSLLFLETPIEKAGVGSAAAAAIICRWDVSSIVFTT